MKLHAGLADMIHMSPISSNLFLFLLLTWICVRTAVLPVELALVGGSAGAGTASRHPFSLPIPLPIRDHLAQPFLWIVCSARASLALPANHPPAAAALDLNHNALLFARLGERVLWALQALPSPVAAGGSFVSFASPCCDVWVSQFGEGDPLHPLQEPVMKIYEVIFSRSKALFKPGAVIYW